MKILMIEDNKSVSEMMGMFFQKEKWDASFAYDGNEAVDMFNASPNDWDMITLDLNLPGKDGMEVAKEIRKVSKTVPIIMLTAKSTDMDKIKGLVAGADDYVTKPFNNQVLVARIRNQLRKTSTEQSLNTVTYKSLKVVEDEFRAELNDEPLDLTKTEFDILLLLVKHPGRVYTRGQMISSLKNGEYADITDRSVDVQILNLRRKLGDFASNIETIRGVGYRMQQLSGADR